MIDVLLAVSFLPAACAAIKISDRLWAWVDRARHVQADRHARPDVPPAPTSSGLRRLVGAGQPWPHNVDGYLELDGCWANRLTRSGMVRCGTPDTNVDGLCAEHATTLQQVRDEHARLDRKEVGA